MNPLSLEGKCAVITGSTQGLGEEAARLFKERGAVVTTTLALVIITTVLFGSFMPVV